MNTIWAFNKIFVPKGKCEEPNYRRNISYSLATFVSMVDFGKQHFPRKKNDNDMGNRKFFNTLMYIL